MSSGICLRSKAEFHEKNCYVSAASESVHAFSFAAIYNYLRVISFPVIKSFTEINTPLSAVSMNGTKKRKKKKEKQSIIFPAALNRIKVTPKYSKIPAGYGDPVAQALVGAAGGGIPAPHEQPSAARHGHCCCHRWALGHAPFIYTSSLWPQVLTGLCSMSAFSFSLCHPLVMVFFFCNFQ